jgi:radical SAM superfamily enzyme YgiQ (UPF0313 family)
VGFRDELFTMDKEWTLEICSQYGEKIGVPFSCEVHPHTIDNDLARALKLAGAKVVAMGVQSGSERVRREVYNRKVSNQQIIEAAGLLVKQRIKVQFDFIFDNPYEKRGDLEESFNTLLQIPRPYTMFLYSLTYFPDTSITKRALEDKIIKPEDVEGASEKPIRHFHQTFDNSLNKDQAFYSSLFWLANIKFSFNNICFYYYDMPDDIYPVHAMPVWALRMMGKSRKLSENPEKLLSIQRLFIRRLNRLLGPLRRIKKVLGV